MKLPIKIAIVDDQNLFREGLRLILGAYEELEIVFEAESGKELLELMAIQQPELVLLDYTMPEMNGYEVLKILKTKYPTVKVVILSMHYDEALMSFLMQNGADGYLLKDETSITVKEAIIEVVQKGKYFPSYVSAALLKQLQNQTKPIPKAALKTSEALTFSLREKEILALVGKQNRQAMAQQLFISIKTIDFHLKKLRDKTASKSTAELVRFAVKSGFQD